MPGRVVLSPTVRIHLPGHGGGCPPQRPGNLAQRIATTDAEEDLFTLLNGEGSRSRFPAEGGGVQMLPASHHETDHRRRAADLPGDGGQTPTPLPQSECQLLLLCTQVSVVTLHPHPPMIGCCPSHRTRCAHRWNPPTRMHLLASRCGLPSVPTFSDWPSWDGYRSSTPLTQGPLEPSQNCASSFSMAYPGGRTARRRLVRAASQHRHWHRNHRTNSGRPFRSRPRPSRQSGPGRRSWPSRDDLVVGTDPEPTVRC